jgi:PPOX class probable F420-dependent enzyme
VGTNQRKQIEMSHDEVVEFLEQQRVVNIATVGPTGMPHVVAMWYALVDGAIWFETKAKSQKIQNLRRDPRISCLVEAGHTYDTLRGVELEGTAEIVDDAERLWDVGVSVWERYNGPYSEEVRPLVEMMLTKRVAVRVQVDRMRTWDHRKLGMPAMALGGTTAAFLDPIT